MLNPLLNTCQDLYQKINLQWVKLMKFKLNPNMNALLNPNRYEAILISKIEMKLSCNVGIIHNV